MLVSQSCEFRFSISKNKKVIKAGTWPCARTGSVRVPACRQALCRSTVRDRFLDLRASEVMSRAGEESPRASTACERLRQAASDSTASSPGQRWAESEAGASAGRQAGGSSGESGEHRASAARGNAPLVVCGRASGGFRLLPGAERGGPGPRAPRPAHRL